MLNSLSGILLFAGFFNGLQNFRLGRREDLGRGFFEAFEGGLFGRHGNDSTINAGGLQ